MPRGVPAGQLKARSVGRHEIDPNADTFSLLAELALGLGGFTGVAAAFGGRDRAYALAERMRLLSIFLSAGGALAGSLCVLTLASSGASAAATYAYASVLGAVPQALHVSFIRETYGLVFDAKASTSLALLVLLIAYIIATFGLLTMNAIYWREAWPLAASFSLQLVWGLWLYSRILTRRN